VIRRNPVICFDTISGQTEPESPYLWNNEKKSRPLSDEMKITHHGRSETVNRAMSDSGSEESSEEAAKRFEEHYKYDCCAGTVSGVTKRIAEEAQEYVEEKLSEAGKKYGQSCERTEKILIGMDGCGLRTGISKLSENSEQTTPVHGNPKKEKVINRRDAGTGFARHPDAVSEIYVGKTDKYPEVVGQLSDASILIGMTPETQVIGIADGGIGLKEESENQFPNMRFISDKARLRDHLYDTAESSGISEKKRNEWVSQRIDAISNGEVGRVKKESEEQYEKSGNKRLNRLIGYPGRFYNCVNYNDFGADGYPVGSGEIESAHKYVPQKRLKLPGACRHPDSINPMSALRVLRANDWWNEFWEKRIEIKAA
jgi:hypothetical protein